MVTLQYLKWRRSRRGGGRGVLTPPPNFIKQNYYSCQSVHFAQLLFHVDHIMLAVQLPWQRWWKVLYVLGLPWSATPTSLYIHSLPSLQSTFPHHWPVIDIPHHKYFTLHHNIPHYIINIPHYIIYIEIWMPLEISWTIINFSYKYFVFRDKHVSMFHQRCTSIGRLRAAGWQLCYKIHIPCFCPSQRSIWPSHGCTLMNCMALGNMETTHTGYSVLESGKKWVISTPLPLPFL